jgi:hypothetical protein
VCCSADRTMENRRKSARTEVEETAYISCGGASTRCQIINISDDGAAILVPDPSNIPSRFQLMTEKDRVIRNCVLIWIMDLRIGIMFEKAPRTE